MAVVPAVEARRITARAAARSSGPKPSCSGSTPRAIVVAGLNGSAVEVVGPSSTVVVVSRNGSVVVPPVRALVGGADDVGEVVAPEGRVVVGARVVEVGPGRAVVVVDPDPLAPRAAAASSRPTHVGLPGPHETFLAVARIRSTVAC